MIPFRQAAVARREVTRQTKKSSLPPPADPGAVTTLMEPEVPILRLITNRITHG